MQPARSSRRDPNNHFFESVTVTKATTGWHHLVAGFVLAFVVLWPAAYFMAVQNGLPADPGGAFLFAISAAAIFGVLPMVIGTSSGPPSRVRESPDVPTFPILPSLAPASAAGTA